MVSKFAWRRQNFYMFGVWPINSLAPADLTGLDDHRLLNNPDKKRESDWFPLQKSTSVYERVESFSECFPTMGAKPIESLP